MEIIVFALLNVPTKSRLLQGHHYNHRHGQLLPEDIFSIAILTPNFSFSVCLSDCLYVCLQILTLHPRRSGGHGNQQTRLGVFNSPSSLRLYIMQMFVCFSVVFLGGRLFLFRFVVVVSVRVRILNTAE